MSAHPCPVPPIPRKGNRAGGLWACECGIVHVLRRWWNYAGEGYEWVQTNLRTEER